MISSEKCHFRTRLAFLSICIWLLCWSLTILLLLQQLLLPNYSLQSSSAYPPALITLLGEVTHLLIFARTLGSISTWLIIFLRCPWTSDTSSDSLISFASCCCRQVMHLLDHLPLQTAIQPTHTRDFFSHYFALCSVVSVYTERL